MKKISTILLLIILSVSLNYNLTQISIHKTIYCDESTEQVFLVEKKNSVKVSSCFRLRNDIINRYIKLRHFGNGTMELNEECSDVNCTICSPLVLGYARATQLERKICFVFLYPRKYSITLKKWNENKNNKYYIKTYYKERDCKTRIFSWGYPLNWCIKSTYNSIYRQYDCINDTPVITQSINNTCRLVNSKESLSTKCLEYDYSISSCHRSSGGMRISITLILVILLIILGLNSHM